MKSKQAFYLISILTAFCILLAACGSSKNLAGTWERTNSESSYVMRFYDDGSCLDVYDGGDGGANAVSWKQQEDGMLILGMEWGSNATFEPAKTKEEALENEDLYYLSGNTLIFLKYEYKRQ